MNPQGLYYFTLFGLQRQSTQLLSLCLTFLVHKLEIIIVPNLERCLKIKWVNILVHRSEQYLKVAQSCPTLCDPTDYTVHRILQLTILEWVAFPFSRGSPNPGIKPKSLALQADSLPTEPLGKPRNTGVGSLSLPQQIFLTQELNQGLLHCRQILYQLSHQGSLVTTDQTWNDHCYSCY